MYGEHSKSEQLLNNLEASSANTTAITSSSVEVNKDRKASIDSNYYSAGEHVDFSIPRLPTSKSEDTLVVTRKKGPTNLHQRKRPTTINPFLVAESQSTKTSNGLVVHRVNTQILNELQDAAKQKPQQQQSSSSSSNEVTSPGKSKLRVSHQPKSAATNQQQQVQPQKKDIKKYHAEEEATLVTFLKPTLTAIQNESHNRSFKDPLIIVEDEAIEMISSPFSKTPVERRKTSSKQQQQPSGVEKKLFSRSNFHSKNVQSICEDAHAQSNHFRAFNDFAKIKDSSQTAIDDETFKSDIQSQIEEILMERDYVNQSSLENASSILQIYAAYNTGLACGTSLKLKCTQKTTAKEVVDLVVKQLNMAVVLKGKVSFKIYFIELKIINFLN
jgi:hypothetical protein